MSDGQELRPNAWRAAGGAMHRTARGTWAAAKIVFLLGMLAIAYEGVQLFRRYVQISHAQLQLDQQRHELLMQQMRARGQAMIADQEALKAAISEEGRSGPIRVDASADAGADAEDGQ